jgi:hypothetical protein
MPNPAHALDCGIAHLFYVARRWRAINVHRWGA